MSNIRGLYDDVKEDTEKEKEEKRRRDANNRYVGGVGAQGGGRYVVTFVYSRSCLLNK